eukprot:403364556
MSDKGNRHLFATQSSLGQYQSQSQANYDSQIIEKSKTNNNDNFSTSYQQNQQQQHVSFYNSRNNVNNKTSTSFNNYASNERGNSVDNSSLQLRVKTLKRYSLKSKAANVLQRIGFPQKKYKIQEDLRKIKKEIGSKMEDDNQEFFDLLNKTSQSFFENMNESLANQTMYGGMNLLAPTGHTEYGGPNDTIDSSKVSTRNIQNFGRIAAFGGGSMQRPLTQVKNRNILIPQPQGNNYATLRNPSSQRQNIIDQRSYNQTQLQHSSQKQNDKNQADSFLNVNQQNENNRPVTSLYNQNSINQKVKMNRNMINIQSGTESTKMTMHTNTSTAGRAISTAFRSKMNLTTSNFKGRNTTLDSISKSRNTLNSLKKLDQLNDSKINISHMNQTQNDMLNSIMNDQKAVGKGLNNSTMQTVDFGGIQRERSISNDRKNIYNDLNGGDTISLNLSQVEKKSNSRTSFKRSRMDLYNSQHMSIIEKQFDAIKHVMSNDQMIGIKAKIVRAYEIISYPQMSLEVRKNSLIEIWTQIIDTVKQSSDLSTFDLIFYTQKVLGDFYMDFKDLSEAVRVYKSLKILCEDFQKYKEKMFIYEQIGNVYRLMKDSESAVKQFKKQLQLAWQEGDTQMEVSAYDNLSIDYFYMGELAKSNYYHDRIMRGKTENNKSIVKKVSCNLLVSRREHRHNIELRKTGEKRKVSEQQRLPSPSAISKGAQFSKAINLLPYYTESQALGIQEEDEEEMSLGQQTKKQKLNQSQSQQKKFTQKELLYLNKLPPYEYLKPKPDDKLMASKSYYGRSQSSSNKTFLAKQNANEHKGVFRQEEPLDYKPFDEDRFREIVFYALQKKETSHTTDDKRNLSHLSVHRTAPLNVMHPTKMLENMRKVVENYATRLVQLALQDKLIKQRDLSVKRESNN